jgi:hypothetical protein
VNNATIEVTITTTDEREDMFAELFVDGTQWAEVTLVPGTGTSTVTIFPPLDGEPYRFSVDEIKRALDEAVMRLRKVEGV